MEHDEIRNMLKKQFNDKRKENLEEFNLRRKFDEIKNSYRYFGDAEAHFDEMYRILNKKRKPPYEGPTNVGI